MRNSCRSVFSLTVFACHFTHPFRSTPSLTIFCHSSLSPHHVDLLATFTHHSAHRFCSPAEFAHPPCLLSVPPSNMDRFSFLTIFGHHFGLLTFFAHHFCLSFLLARRFCSPFPRFTFHHLSFLAVFLIVFANHSRPSISLCSTSSRCSRSRYVQSAFSRSIPAFAPYNCMNARRSTRQAGLCMFFMAISLLVCSRPVIAPLLGALLGGGGGGGSESGHGSGTVKGLPVHVGAFCGVFLGLYLLGVVSRHFPDSRTVIDGWRLAVFLACT